MAWKKNNASTFLDSYVFPHKSHLYICLCHKRLHQQAPCPLKYYGIWPMTGDWGGGSQKRECSYCARSHVHWRHLFIRIYSSLKVAHKYLFKVPLNVLALVLRPRLIEVVQRCLRPELVQRCLLFCIIGFPKPPHTFVEAFFVFKSHLQAFHLVL